MLKKLHIENDELIVINEELKVKTDEMDFQDKKMEMNLHDEIIDAMLVIEKGKKRIRV